VKNIKKFIEIPPLFFKERGEGGELERKNKKKVIKTSLKRGLF
jgi:hypothetical protein